MSTPLFCKGPECTRPATVKRHQLCHAHYTQHRRKGRLQPLATPAGPPRPCLGPGCTRNEKVRYLQLCHAHYAQHRNNKPLTPLTAPTPAPRPTCTGPDCTRTQDNLTHQLCHAHDEQRRRKGTLTPLRPQTPLNTAFTATTTPVLTLSPEEEHHLTQTPEGQAALRWLHTRRTHRLRHQHHTALASALNLSGAARSVGGIKSGLIPHPLLSRDESRIRRAS